MKRKLIAIMLSVMMCISLAACGNSTEATANDAASSNANDETVIEPAEAETEEVAAEDTAEPEAEDVAEPETEETTENETEEAAEAETTEAEAEETPTLDPAESAYTYTDMEATMYAKQSVNVRDLPSTDGNRLGGLSTNQEVAITGQCNETGWYRFEYNGQTAYVSNSYVSDTKIEVAAADPAPEQAAPAQETTSASTSSGLPAGVLDLTTLPREQWVDRGDWLVYVHGVWNDYPSVGDLGPLMRSFGERRPDAEVSAGACKFYRDLGISVVWMQFKYGGSPEADTTFGYYAKYEVAPW